jgi:cupin fold WbuC family metalloprotein
MKLDKQLFDSVAKLAAESPRLRMNYDLRDSENEDGQRMLNVLLPGTKSAVHRHTDTREVVVCIYGSAIERFYDDKGNETEMVVMTAGSDCPGVVVEQGRYHSLEATNKTSGEPVESMAVIMEAKAHRYHPFKTEDILDK